MTHPVDSGKANDVILEMRGIRKSFPGILVIDHVDFNLRLGEIHALLGENGAGKTTLMNILYGLLGIEGGEIWIQGRKTTIGSPRDAIALGIGMIHQSFALVSSLSVLENIVLGIGFSKGPFLDLRLAEKEIVELERRFGLEVELNARPDRLSSGEKQRVEILKALYRRAKILIMDEPTSVLTPLEKDELIRSIRRMADGCLLSVIFITHKISEVFEVSDRVTVLRKGQVVDVLETRKTDQRELTRRMIGRDLLHSIPRMQIGIGEVVLSAQRVEAQGGSVASSLKGVTFNLHSGEILGVAGVSGNGQRELAEVLAGRRRLASGRVYVKGFDVSKLGPRKARELGVGYVPEDRLGEGILPGMSLIENLALGVQSFEERTDTNIAVRNPILLQHDKIREYAKRLVEEYGIHAASLDIAAEKLSGGNIAKVILARELSRRPDILVADKPTSGLDLASQESIRIKLIKERDSGKAVFMISEDLDELAMMSDRIMVMYEGRAVGIMSSGEMDRNELGRLMGGEIVDSARQSADHL